MARKTHDPEQLTELLYQALETEIGGIKVYEAAVGCAVNEELKQEWQEYLAQTRTHREVLLKTFDSLGLDANVQTPGRQVVAHIGQALVKAMRMAKAAGDPAAAERVAGECVVLAETKDHLNWELIGHVAEHGKGPATSILQAAYDEVEDDEDRHLYHTAGWTRELWIDALGLPAVLPPPEEVKNVQSAIGASRAEQGRSEMLKKRH